MSRLSKRLQPKTLQPKTLRLPCSTELQFWSHENTDLPSFLPNYGKCPVRSRWFYFHGWSFLTGTSHGRSFKGRDGSVRADVLCAVWRLKQMPTCSFNALHRLKSGMICHYLMVSLTGFSHLYRRASNGGANSDQLGDQYSSLHAGFCGNGGMLASFKIPGCPLPLSWFTFSLSLTLLVNLQPGFLSILPLSFLFRFMWMTFLFWYSSLLLDGFINCF